VLGPEADDQSLLAGLRLPAFARVLAREHVDVLVGGVRSSAPPRRGRRPSDSRPRGRGRARSPAGHARGCAALRGPPRC
jgi:hypothetical protein